MIQVVQLIFRTESRFKISLETDTKGLEMKKRLKI